MSLRNVLNEKPVVAWGFAGVALLGLLAMAMAQRGGPGGEAQFFFDLNTGKLVAGWSSTASPDPDSPGTFTYPDGEAGAWVRANVWGCPGVDHGVEAGMTEEEVVATGAMLVNVQRQPIAPASTSQGGAPSGAGGQAASGAATLVSNAKGKTWVRMLSPRVQEVSADLSQLCGGVTPVYQKP